MNEYKTCQNCGSKMSAYKNPAPTVDVIIYDENHGIILIERANEPHGFALPGGFIDYGESAEQAAVREMLEETNLNVELCGLLGVYSNPTRDIRFHTMSIAFVAKATNINELCAGDDAKAAAFFNLEKLPKLAFDHAKLIADFNEYLQGKRKLIAIDNNNLPKQVT